MYRYRMILFLITVIGIISCETETEKLDDSYLGYNYYPIEIGNEWVYKLDSFLYSNEGIYKDTASWYVKETITKEHNIGDETGNYVLERSLSKDNINWRISDVWTIKKTATNIQKTEENHTFIKLIFPPKIGKRWEGNAFIDETDTVMVFGESFKMFNNWSYKILEELDELELESQTYKDVLKVREVDEPSAIDIRKSYTYYAKNIGLILEERMILFDQSNGTDEIPWAEKADKGFILRRSLISYKLN